MSSQITLPTDKVRIRPVGMEITSELSIDEWSQLAGPIGNASRSVAFIIGDWLIHGEKAFRVKQNTSTSRIASKKYHLALANTGLDLTTLQNYAYVSRKVPLATRSEQLSWEHHKVLAKLPPLDQQVWIERCHEEMKAGNPISTRRLRKSISLGRLATPDDLEPDPADRGIENHIPFVNRIVSWWHRLQDGNFLGEATPEQREALKRDLQPVIKIYEEL